MKRSTGSPASLYCSVEYTRSLVHFCCNFLQFRAKPVKVGLKEKRQAEFRCLILSVLRGVCNASLLLFLIPLSWGFFTDQYKVSVIK